MSDPKQTLQRQINRIVTMNQRGEGVREEKSETKPTKIVIQTRPQEDIMIVCSLDQTPVESACKAIKQMTLLTVKSRVKLYKSQT